MRGYDAENDEPGWVLVGIEGAPGLKPGGRLWPQEEAAVAELRGLPPGRLG